MMINARSSRGVLLASVLVSWLLLSVTLPTPVASVAAQQVSPAGTLTQLSIDDGESNCTGGNTTTGLGFGWVNKLKPPTYPATLRSITIDFQRLLIGPGVGKDALYRIVVYADPEDDGLGEAQQPVATFTGRVRGDFVERMTYNLITPVTISEGSFIVGAIDDFGFGRLPALFDIPGRSTPPGSESFVTFNGGATWATQAEVFGDLTGCNTSTTMGAAGSWLIRATVESAPAEVTTTSKLKDPAAVEPWGVAVNEGRGDAYVTNYVSDNVTIVNVAANSLQTLPVGDGTGGAPDGPFGVTVDALDSRVVYVSLFGSNTIPSKEFPVDPTTLAPGRVAVLMRQANGAYTQEALLTVGRGPKVMASVPPGAQLFAKLYVPCSGDNRVEVFNAVTRAKIRDIAVGSEPSSCTTSIDGAKVYVTNAADGTISVIDTRTDTKIKDIVVPGATPPAPGLPPLPALQNPVNATIAAGNGNLYVAYNGAADNPNGAIVEIDTCTDSVLRVISDPSIPGSAAGAAGATGIAAPTAALTRDPGTGLTPNAGGGGGGPFGIAAFKNDNNPALVFTNDASGIAAVLDTRIDQVVTAPPVPLAACPKPRGVAVGRFANQNIAVIACGQPDSSITILRFPTLPENISTIPVINSVDIGKKIFVNGSNFVTGTRIEILDPVTGVCLSFRKAARVQQNGTRLLQKGVFTDGRAIRSVLLPNGFAWVRVIAPDGTVRLFQRLAVPVG